MKSKEIIGKKREVGIDWSSWMGRVPSIIEHVMGKELTSTSRYPALPRVPFVQFGRSASADAWPLILSIPIRVYRARPRRGGWRKKCRWARRQGHVIWREGRVPAIRCVGPTMLSRCGRRRRGRRVVWKSSHSSLPTTWRESGWSQHTAPFFFSFLFGDISPFFFFWKLLEHHLSTMTILVDSLQVLCLEVSWFAIFFSIFSKNT